MLSLPLFIIVMEELTSEVISGCPEELLHANNLELDSESLENLEGKLGAWKGVLA